MGSARTVGPRGGQAGLSAVSRRLDLVHCTPLPPRAVNCWLLVGAVVTVCGSRAGLLVAGPLPALCALRRSGCGVAFGKGRSFALTTRTLTLVVWRCECCVCVVSFPHAIMEIDIITC